MICNYSFIPPFFQSTPVYWPTGKDRPMVIAQLTVSLVADEDLEEGTIKMTDFEIKINNKVNCHVNYAYYHTILYD